MFWEIDSIDIVTDGGAGHEARQVDARTPQEIEREPELAVLVAVARIVAPPDEFIAVHYHCKERPPPFFADAVRICGAALHVGDKELFAPVGRIHGDEVVSLINGAFAALGRRLGATVDVEANLALLFAAEESALATPPAPDSAEYWFTVLRLSALTASCIRGEGSWRIAKGYGTVPFVFAALGSTVNIAGKAERFLARGESQRPSGLLRALADASARGQPCVVLKPSDKAVQGGCCRRLLDVPERLLHQVPWVVAAEERPNSFSFAKSAGVDVAAQIEAGIAGLAAVQVEVELEEDIIVVSGHQLAAEKILDASFMIELQERLNASAVFAAVPCRGLLLVTAAEGDGAAATFVGVAQHAFEDAGDEGISPTVFVVAAGVVQGLAVDLPG